jgi:hypothetical protein
MSVAAAGGASSGTRPANARRIEPSANGVRSSTTVVADLRHSPLNECRSARSGRDDMGVGDGSGSFSSF